MRNNLLLLLILLSLNSFAQNTKAAFDGAAWRPPYSLGFPEKWGVERFPIPIEFAPEILYNGVEDIRFAPGWGNPESSEYWSYAFLWYLDGSPEMTAAVIETNLQLYYDGLIGRNIEKRKIPAEKLFKTKAAFKKVKTAAGDLKTFEGSVHMLDYMKQTPVTLNSKVHIRTCSNHKNKTFVFYEISPKPLKEGVWQQLDELYAGLNCAAPVKNK